MRQIRRFIQTTDIDTKRMISNVHLYDTHIHLTDPEYTPYMDTIVRGMSKTHTVACCVSMDESDSEQTLNLADKYDSILAFVGIHPEKAVGGCGELLRIIDENAKHISGIGEIGLDPTLAKDRTEYNEQMRIFDELLEAAEKHRKPISIHSRKSVDDVLDALSTHSIHSACLHWYDGNKKQLRRAVDEGLYLGYGPVMVYANDKKSLLEKTPRDQILVETDGPVRFSRCFGMRSAQVSFIPSVIYAASQVLDQTYTETEQIVQKNSERFLGLGV
ncbi:MAG: TatD-related DNase [Cenarchaeum symbiont of Oopsacas minuta]|nr:TatD-related DNase [Cenarchaeum symbiont of Oopsacas minuta]